MKTQRFFQVGLVLALSLLALPTIVLSQSSSWLHRQPPENWNQLGANIPKAPHSNSMNVERCQQQIRNPSTPEERAVRAAGWMLYKVRNTTSSVSGISLVEGLTDFDGMCRPIGYQEFVFVNGIFAGTTSPVIMDARSDGALFETKVEGPSRLTSQFARYAKRDALCCPSNTSEVTYQIDFQNNKPLLVPLKIRTYANPHQ